MKTKAFATLALWLAMSLAAGAAGIRKAKISVLYVGGSPDINLTSRTDSVIAERSVKKRMASFGRFLKSRFASVRVIRADQYEPSLSEQYDVTIMDGTPRELEPKIQTFDGNGHITENRRPLYLPYDFSRPMLTIAEAGAITGQRIGVKNDWYCLCLMSDALGVDTTHPIFKGPFPVSLTLRTKAVAEEAKALPIYFKNGVAVDSMPMWRVQRYDATRGHVGMVSRPGGYDDSPDAEIISGGVSGKSVDAVAIGRHGNFFQWGFAASPDDMTGEARAVFANAVVYISQFAGKHPIARKYLETIMTRYGVRYLAYAASKECYKKACEETANINRTYGQARQRALEKQAKGGELTARDKSFASFKPHKIPSYNEYLRQRYPRLYAIYGDDEKGYQDYYKNNSPYFIPDGRNFDVIIDEDARSLGIANNSRNILEKAINLMESGEDAAKGLRLLRRYTLCSFATAGEWRAWYEKYKDKLFFTEAGGWKFLVNSYEPGVVGNDYPGNASPNYVPAETTAGHDVELATDAQNPVAVGVDQQRGADGSTLVKVRFKLHPTFHIYATVGDGDPYIATSITFSTGRGVGKVGGMKSPLGKAINQKGTTVLEGDAVYGQVFSGKGQVVVRVEYQACNDQMCLPPAEKTFTVSIE